MKKKTKDKLKHDVVSFLEENGWEVFDEETEQYFAYLYRGKIEELPYKPKYLIQKGKQRMWAYYFWKGNYPFWKSQMGEVTGFDWLKYKMMQGLTEITEIPCAILFDSESQPEIIFRQLDQLPKPKHSRGKKSNCRRAYEPYGLLRFKCFQCWKENFNTFRMCMQEKKKTKTGLAIWKKEYFQHNTIHQPSLIPSL